MSKKVAAAVVLSEKMVGVGARAVEQSNHLLRIWLEH